MINNKDIKMQRKIMISPGIREEEVNLGGPKFVM